MNAVPPTRSPIPVLPLRLSPRTLGLPALVGALVGALAMGCGAREPEPPPRPPILLITFEGLAASSAGAGYTPAYDAFAAEADWAGRGVAPSSRPLTSGASLATGLDPWRHRVLVRGDRLDARFLTLAETLATLGYHSSGYFSGALHGPRGFQQGFDFFRTLYRGRGARSHLRTLRGEPELIWLHLRDPSPPWLLRDWLFPDGEAPPGLPERIGADDLDPYRHPGAVPPEAERRRFEALYRNNVAFADLLLGRFLEDLRNSGHWDDAVVAVTSTHGEDLGTGQGSVAVENGLSRSLLEVPLAIKLPRVEGDAAAPRAVPLPDERVGTVRLFATLVEAAGGRAPPGVAPGLFRSGAAEGVLSELYDHRGTNRFSWLRGDLQLLRSLPLPVSEAPSPVRFEATPLAGPPHDDRGDPEGEDEGEDGAGGSGGSVDGSRLLLRWTAEGIEPVHDPRRMDELTLELRHRWARFLPPESAPVRGSEGSLAQLRDR